MRDNMNLGFYDATNVDKFIDDVLEIVNEYDKQGPVSITKTEILVNFLDHFLKGAHQILMIGIRKKETQDETKSAYETVNFQKKEETYNQQIKALQQKVALQDEQIDKLRSEKQKEENASNKARKDLEKAKAEEQAKMEEMKRKHDEEKRRLEEKKKAEAEELKQKHQKTLEEMERNMKKKGCCTIF